MPNNLLRFMDDSFLFRPKHIDNNYSKFNDSELTKELDRYRHFCLENVSKEPLDTQNLDIFIEGTYHLPDEALLKQCALYIRSVVINDPVFRYTLPKTRNDEVMNSYLGMDSDGMNRSGLVTAASYINHHREAIHSNYVKFLPISYLHEPPKEIPLKYSEVLFSDVLPKDILEYFRTNAKVVQLQRGDKGWHTIENELLAPCRGIVVSFAESLTRNYPYMLFQTQVISYDDETGHGKFVHSLPETPPDEESFNAWVYQSINQAARRCFDEIYREVSVASKIGSTYLTRSPFVHNLLCRAFHVETDLKSDIVNAVLELELPLLQGISLEHMLDLRRKDGDVFENFRIELEKQLRELRSVTDPNELQIRLEDVVHELTEVQIHEINKKISSIKRGMLADAMILVGGLAVTIQTNGFGILALIYAIEKGYKTYQEYISSIRENPAFFLWKLKNK